MDKKVRSFKLQEFFAHNENINTAALGKQSARVLATGSDDRKVHVYKLGKSKPLLVLGGNTTEVDCVMFDPLEEVIACGSRGGTVKLWDLQDEKIFRNLTGHRASVNCVDFHPFGDFFASGSKDTNMKVWDIRKKGCLQTFTGHTAPVSCIKHSPDGRWIMSGDRNGVISVWDITIGKSVKEFQIPKAPVQFDFHPDDFLMSIAAGKQIFIVDLEDFEIVSQTPHDAHPIQSMMFSPEGEAILAGSQDVLKVWGWEPVRCYDTVDVGFTEGLCDIAVSPNNELVGAVKRNNVMSIHVVYLADVAPFKFNTKEDKKNSESNLRNQSHSKNGVNESRQTAKDLSPSEKDGSNENPVTSQASKKSSSKGDDASNQMSGLENSSRTKNNKGSNEANINVKAAENISYITTRDTNKQQRSKNVNMIEEEKEFPINQTFDIITGSNSSKKLTSQNVSKEPQQASKQSLKGNDLVDAPKDKPLGLSVSQFIQAEKPNIMPEIDEEKIQKRVMKDNRTMCGIMSQRLTNLKMLKAFWTTGNIKGAVEAVVKMNDLPTAADFLRSASKQFNNNILTLEMARDFLPLLSQLLDSRFEEYVKTALRYLKLILDSFMNLIVETRNAEKQMKGSNRSGFTNLQHEERLEKCNACFEHFISIKKKIDPMTTKQSGVGDDARIVRKLLNYVGKEG